MIRGNPVVTVYVRRAHAQLHHLVDQGTSVVLLIETVSLARMVAVILGIVSLAQLDSVAA
jgi:hypothetical protein